MDMTGIPYLYGEQTKNINTFELKNQQSSKINKTTQQLFPLIKLNSTTDKKIEQRIFPVIEKEEQKNTLIINGEFAAN